MPPLTLATVLQIAIAVGLLNVWLLRSSSATAYRGGDAKSLREEFQAYGLPGWVYPTVGALKVGSGLALLAGLWVPALVLPAAALVAALMLGAVSMHAKVQDAPIKYLPATLMLLMSGALVAQRWA